jgi:TetR/AcrR family transcriptional repressor of nem operon
MIRDVGYNAFSYSDIGEHMQIRPAAIHYHFHTKNDLGLEVIRQELERVAQFRRRNLSAEDQLKQLFYTFLRQSVENQLCLMGSLTPDFATFDEPLQEKIKELCGAILEWVAQCLEKERSAYRMRFNGRADDRALLVISTLLSSLLLGRVMGSYEVFTRMADQLLADLGAGWRVDDLGEVPEDFDDPHSYT